MSAIPNLSSISNISRLGSGGGGGSLQKAYSFDGVNDYIAGDTVIGRTGYDMNVAGNVSTSSDGDGSYFWVNGNRTTTPTGTAAQIAITSGVVYTQATSFTMKARFKFTAFPPVSSGSGVFGSNFDAFIYLNNTNLSYGLRGSSTVINTTAVSINTLYDGYLVYDASDTKFYFYLGTSGGASTLINAGGTSGPATFSTLDWIVGDNGIGGSTTASCNKYIYHCAIRNVALSQAEVDADIALGNTTKSDSRIVAYYVPENLQYNTQYMLNPTDLANASWTKGANTTVTANTSVAPDGTTTADRVQRSGATIANSSIQYNSTSISGVSLASKTMIIKAFVKTTSGTQLFRLGLEHVGVAGYNSSNLTATVDRQEFTFTQAFTSSSSGTGVGGRVCIESALSNADIQVWNVRVFLTNETLRDEIPNIGGYIGWKTNKVFSCWCKPGVDPANTADAGALVIGPRAFLHLRGSNVRATIRYDNRIGAQAIEPPLGAGFRNKVHIIGAIYRNGSVWASKIYIDGILVTSATSTVDAANGSVNTVSWSGRKGSTYYTGLIRDSRIYTGTITDADALAIYTGGQPSTAVQYLRRRPSPGESGTTAIDASGNSRTGTLTGGVTRVTRPST